MIPQIIPTAEPFFFSGGSTGCLLIHGFTGTPKEMRKMGEYLNKQGFTVLGIRLAGHATQPEDLRGTQWQDWLASVEDGWYLLRGVTDQVFVCGLSLGGILSLMLASQFPVAGVVAMSTIFEMPPDPRLRLIRYLKYLQPKLPKGEPDWQDPKSAIGHVEYPYAPTHSIVVLADLINQMQNRLKKITAPTLLIHSRNDQVVAPENMEKIHTVLGSQKKEMLWIENSGHAITCDAESEFVFKAAADFIQQVLTTSQ